MYHKRKTEIAEGKFLDKKKDQRIKFEDFADEYFKKYSMVFNKSWKKSDKVLIKTLKAFFSGYCLSEITKDVIAQFKAKRINEVSGSTINRNLACLKSIFNRAIEWGKYDGVNPVVHEKMFKEPEGRTRYLNPKELEHLIKCCESRFKPYVIVAVHTGLRLSEMLSLKWGDLDFTEGVIYVLPQHAKTDRLRGIPMTNVARVALKSIKKQSDSDYVFCNKNKKPNAPIRGAFERALKKAEIKEFHWHDLRHTTASLLAMSGIDLNTIREILGHTTMKMTQRYTHLSKKHMKDAVSVLDEISNGSKRHQKSLDKSASNNINSESITILSQSVDSNLDKDFNSIVISLD